MDRKRVAVLISYDICTDRFSSLYERNKFFRGLFGFRQVVKKENKNYAYEKPGLLTGIPHIKVGDSVFIIAQKYLKAMVDYFEEWEKKVNYQVYEVVLDDKKWKKIVIE